MNYVRLAPTTALIQWNCHAGKPFLKLRLRGLACCTAATASSSVQVRPGPLGGVILNFGLRFRSMLARLVRATFSAGVQPARASSPSRVRRGPARGAPLRVRPRALLVHRQPDVDQGDGAQVFKPLLGSVVAPVSVAVGHAPQAIAFTAAHRIERTEGHAHPANIADVGGDLLDGRPLLTVTDL